MTTNPLEFPLILKIRRNHGLEHATIHILSERLRRLRVVGRSQANGFYLYGDLKTDDIAAAVEEALKRLKAGDSRLAVHPGCGTNMVTAGLLAGSIAFVASLIGGRKAHWYDRLPNAALGGVLGVATAQPLGPWLQANVTTSADMHTMRVRRISRSLTGPVLTHFVETLS
ncbi:MAG TPA: DUF6391 domain-containing protein [Anaerolineae bacterium]